MSDQPPTPTPGGGTLTDLVGQARLAWRLLKDPRVPLGLKLVPALAIVYLVSPIDLVPADLVLPGIGHIDDLAVLLIALRLFIQMAPDDVVGRVQGGSDTVSATYRVHDEDEL